MTVRTFVDKNGNSWEWEETPETIEALKQLHETVNLTNQKNSEQQ
jgi:FMN phosphatase YigB (HAD superfamily)